jgi:HEAT repeat protein
MVKRLISILVLAFFTCNLSAQTDEEKKKKEEEELQKKLEKAEKDMKKWEKWMPSDEEMARDRKKLIDKSIKDLKHRDPERRAEAAETLGKMKYEPAVPALAEALKDKDEWVRVEAASALWEMGEPSASAIPSLYEALEDSSGRVRLYSAGALRMLGESEEKIIPALKPVLGSANVWNRAYAIVQLMEMEVRVIELIPAIDSILLDPAYRKPAAYDFDLFSMKFEPVNADPNVEAKRLLLEALDDQKSLPAEIVPALEYAKKDLDELVRSRAISCLSKVEETDDSKIARLITTLKTTKGYDRITAIRLLGDLKPVPREAVPDLIAAVRDKDTDVRAAAVACLGKTKPVGLETVQVLIGVLKDKKTEVRQAAADAFEVIGADGKEAIPALRQVAASDKDVFVQNAAKRALSKMGEEVKW